jgi:methylated-DNA-[protein]-cysteine S-methyltransferase
MKYFYYYNFPFWSLGIAEKEHVISNVFFKKEDAPKGFEEFESPFIIKTANQLEEYFEGKRKTFDLPLTFHGTPFKTSIWETLLKIPYGETRSYGEIAAMINNPKASRAVGMANHMNQIAIIIPCHRVIGHDGSLVGYAGGLELKQKLLDLEKKHKNML